MGFCGCSLYASTVSAGIYGIIFSIYGISWMSVAINAINKWWPVEYFFDTYYGTLFSTDNFFFLKSDQVIYGMVLFSLVLHILWLISSIAVLIGNERKIIATLNAWVGIVSVVLITDFSFAVYCMAKPSGCGLLWQLNFESSIAGRCYGYWLLAMFFDKFGLITIGIETALAIYVSSRVKEIKREALLPTQVICSPASQYAIPAGHGVTKHPFPSDVQQGPSQYGGQGWNVPLSPYTELGRNAVADYRPRKQ